MIFTPKEMAQLRYLEILAGRVMKGQLHGERETLRAGPGSGFREHRGYHPGDELRRVDWNVYARIDSLVIKEFEAEEALDHIIVQDRSASMRGAAARCAAKVAGGLGAIALAHFDRVLWVPVGGSGAGQVFTGRARRRDLLDAVDGEVEGGTDLMASVLGHLPRSGRGGVAFVISDFFDPHDATRALSYLVAHRYQVRAMLVEDLGALAPPPLGRTRLVDAETGRALKVEITREMVEAYERAREARVQGLNAFCRRVGAGFLQVRADQPFLEIVRAAIARGWLTP
jgi:uncharacterized protein (DUF58 family)